jgi:type III restriction enzyme
MGLAQLTDGRLLVVEYKGGDRFSNEDSEEKRNIGALWSKHSNGRGVYLMAQKLDDQGRNV